MKVYTAHAKYRGQEFATEVVAVHEDLEIIKKLIIDCFNGSDNVMKVMLIKWDTASQEDMPKGCFLSGNSGPEYTEY